MIVSVEVPVFKGGWLQRCIDSVLYQSSPQWHLSLLWDGGDQQSYSVLKRLERRRLPNVTIYYRENRGIARARRFLSEHSSGDYILPLDDDDALPCYAVERFLRAAEQRPWASVIRGRREIIDPDGKVLDTPPWFPFEPRHYQDGMVTDVFNHSQPYLIRRSAYARTGGWEGFEDFGYAGEDCDIYLKLEEVGSVELVDEMLYYYRVHSDRASLVLTDDAAYEMWRRLADKTIARIGLPLTRVTEKQPFRYERTHREPPALNDVDFVVIGDGSAAADDACEGVAAAFGAFGMSADALHPVASGTPDEVNACLRRTARPVLCLVRPGVAVARVQDLERFLHLTHQHDADVAGPALLGADGTVVSGRAGFTHERVPMLDRGARANDASRGDVADVAWLPETCVVIRREVIRAVGGFDETFGGMRLAMVDFCLKARQRDFKCRYVASVAFSTVGGDAAGPLADDVWRLQHKWAGHPDLFRAEA